ncbi:MAG TPA: hypothetical protein VFD84_06460 [Candidatus Binatia bacterium]|nr:hypothetical protein [Candidatus Binatia bacterium]
MTTARWIAIPIVLAAATSAAAALVAAPGYRAYSIPTPGPVAGGVVRRGGAILVGQGPAFTAKAEAVVRLDANGATTVATGFNALGGFDLDADGTLFVVDNALEAPGADTGDTLFAIPDALVRTEAVTAAGHEVVPKGTIPSAMDVLLLPDGAALVVDAAGPGAGRIVRVAGAGASDFITGLDYGGGLARATDGSFFVGNVAADFTASIRRYDAAGRLLGAFAADLPGEYAHVFDADGNLLVSGEFSGSCTGRILAIPPGGGTPVERVRGFCFSTDLFFDAARDELLALDAGASEIAAVCRDRDGDGVCDADDDCPTAPDPAQQDTDGDGLADACDPCTGAALAGARLSIRGLGTPGRKATLSLTGEMALPASPALDPVATGVRLLLGDGAVLDAAIPGGRFHRKTRSGWTARKRTFTFRSRAGVEGIHTVVLRRARKRPGVFRLTVKGRGRDFAMGRSPVKVTFIAEAAAGQCAETRFTAAECTTNVKHAALRCR